MDYLYCLVALDADGARDMFVFCPLWQLWRLDSFRVTQVRHTLLTEPQTEVLACLWCQKL